MKKIILFTLILATSFTLFAQKHKVKPLKGRGAVIQFTETSHDFGAVDEGVKATYVFEFINTGDSNLVLNNVQASCGCTVPTWPHQPIKPGQRDKITVVYNSSGRPGEFHKSITVTTNMKLDGVKTLFIQGKVISKPVEPPQPVSPVKIEQN
jgi:hypothetical protein